MNVEDAIKSRRSIRKYGDRAVPDEVVRELLEAARWAPSGCNVQPWRYHVIRDRSTLGRLQEAGAFQQEFVHRAPLVFVCCGDPQAYCGQYGGAYQVKEGSVPEDADARKDMFSIVQGKERLRAWRDVSIATAFLVLRAAELGLGTCFIGLINAQVLREVLAIPEGFEIPYALTAGYFDHNPAPRPRKALEEIILGDSFAV